MKKAMRIVVLIVISAVIFNFSSQTYEEQSLVPQLERLLPGEPFAGILAPIEVTYWGTPISIETKGYYYFLEFFIRKFAHLFLFGCLAAALFHVLALARPRRIWPVFCLSFAGTALYALLDEYHQLLTGGRTPMLKDVGLDLVGAFFALVLSAFFYKIRKRKEKNRLP
ncbi:VanZ family protein [Domibacillus sp.]|uniref:VanZ family protein n=1 Tax=Domibacillus sp. TaxID=1969783 RepID=UPI0028117877|nr:VanZ family protein [Domibacillus sp.]